MNDDIVQSSERSGAVIKKVPVNKLNISKFIQKSNKTHKYKYDYSKSIYISSRNKIIVICKIHGEFSQQASYHMNNSSGCPKCSSEIKSKNVTSNTEEFISKAEKVHLGVYDYSLVNYVNSRTKINIKCSKHGVFSQTPNNHLRDRGCNLCRFEKSTSKAEIDLENFISNLDVTVINSYRPSWLLGKELDLYVPELNLAVEYNGGMYHHSSTNGSEFLNNTSVCKEYHLNKFNVCKTNGVNLLHIFEFESLEAWKELIEFYIQTPESYLITFENLKRDITFCKKDLIFYGKSLITHSP